MLAQGERSTETAKPDAGQQTRSATVAAPGAPVRAAAPAVMPAAGASMPRPPPAGDPLARTLARAVAARAATVEGEVGGLDELVDELSVAIWARKNAQVHYTLKIEAFRLDQIMERFRSRKGRSLRGTLIAANGVGEHREKEFVRALAVLHGGADAEVEPWAQMGLALIPLGTRDIDLMRLLEERPLAQRKRLKADYDRAFAGIGKTANDTLEEHIVSDTSGWQREKALALLDHELTPADHLALVTVAIAGAHDETALEILREVWSRGPAAFDALYEDWHRFVQGPGFTAYPLEQAMTKELGGSHLEAAQAIFAEYHAMRSKAGLRDFASMEGHEGSAERADVRLQETTIEIGLQSGVFTSNGPLVISAARDLRKAWEKRIKRDKSLAAEWVARRERLLLLLAESLGLRGADMVEARIQLVRDPVPVDKIYVASMRREYAKVLKAATEAWLAGSEEGLDHALRHPPERRPPAGARRQRARDPAQRGQRRRVRGARRAPAHASRARRRAVAARAARPRPDDEGRGPRHGLQVPQVDQGRQAAHGGHPGVRRALSRRPRAPPRQRGARRGTRGSARDAITRFCNALQSDATGFEQSPAMIDLLHLLAPGTELADAQAYAERRDRATHTGVLDVAATGLVSIYDTLTAEDTQEVADDALSRLRRWVRSSHASPDELRAVMEAEGVTEVTALAQLGYERFAVRLDEVRSVKASIAEGVGMFVDFAGRSLLVAVLGPAGLPGLLAALGAYSAGMLVREGLLGRRVPARERAEPLDAPRRGRDVRLRRAHDRERHQGARARGRREGAHLRRAGPVGSQAKFAQEYLKGSGAKLFEKAAQNMVEGRASRPPTSCSRAPATRSPRPG